MTATRGRRAAAGGLAGAFFWLLALLELRAGGPLVLGYDFTLHYWAADAVRHGWSPYLLINAVSTAYPFCSGYLYWQATAAMLVPFSFVPLQTAMPIFAGLSVAVFTYAVTVDGWWRLPFVASLPLVAAALGGVITPLVVAAILVPSLGWLAPTKYTIGTAGFAYNLSRRYAILAVGVTLLSVALWPRWPVQWYHELGDVAGKYYNVPALVLPGALVLLAVLRWRRPEARLLFVMALVPQTMLFYDQLPLLLVASSRRQALAFSLVSWIAPIVTTLIRGASNAERSTLMAWNAPVIVALYYLPCLAMVLLRPNQGSLPAWAETAAVRLPAWLRGVPAEQGA